MIKERVVFGAALVLATGVGSAQPQLDKDGDGFVSRYEFEQRAVERFSMLDQDADGYLSETELRQGRAGVRTSLRSGRRGRTFDRADADDDGRLSVTEAEALRPGATVDSLFERADLDADGYLTAEELRESVGRGLERRRSRRAQADTNGDGALSLSEIQIVRPEMSSEQFSRLDVNGDGLITADERPCLMRRRF